MMLFCINLVIGIFSSKVKYLRFFSIDDGYIDFQFKKIFFKIFYKVIVFVIVLFLIGVFFIIIGFFLLLGYISKGGVDWVVLVLIIGILVFLFGFYYLCIVYYVFKGYCGYFYDDILDFDDQYLFYS